MLDLIQQALELHGFKFCRIDGGTSLEKRRSAIRQLNEDRECTIMLATIGSAGEGCVPPVFAYLLLEANNVTVFKGRFDRRQSCTFD